MAEHDHLAAAVTRLLGPLAELLIQHGVTHGTFAEWAKFAYVDAAETQGPIENRKMSTSRVSVLTGLTRKDVARIRGADQPTEAAERTRHHRAARVVTGWIREDAYTDDRGEPLVLPLDGVAPSFESLVKEFGGDVPTRAVLDELERVGTVEVNATKQVRLLARAYVPRKSERQVLELLGTDVGGLIATIQHNLNHPDATKFQRRVYYDNLPDDALPDLQALVAQHGQELLERLDRWMSKRDRDATPHAEGTGRNVAGIGVFYFDDEYDPPSSDDGGEEDK